MNISDYYIISKIFAGTTLYIIFQHKANAQDKQVLELKDVAGFIELPDNEAIMTLQIEEASFYASSLSTRLNQPEIATFQEAYIFTDEDNIQCSFRACARSIVFREWTAADKKLN
jgi:hypothetical protein